MRVFIALALAMIGGAASAEAFPRTFHRGGYSNVSLTADRMKFDLHRTASGLQGTIGKTAGKVQAGASETTTPTTPTYYSGGYGTLGNFVYTFISFETGEIRQPFDRTDQPPIRNLRARNGQLRFEADRLHFELTQFDHEARGWVVDENGKRRPAYFRTRPKDIPSLEVLERYEGSYGIGDGRVLTLSRNNFSDNLHYLELPSGRTGVLFYLPNGELAGGPCIYCPGPEHLRVRLDPRQSGRARRVRVTIDGRTIDATRMETHSEEEVRFVSKDGTQLAGSLLLPSGKEPHPAVVFAHGSNAQTRNGFKAISASWPKPMRGPESPRSSSTSGGRADRRVIGKLRILKFWRMMSPLVSSF